MTNKRRNYLAFMSILFTLSALLTLSFLPTPAATLPPPPLIRLQYATFNPLGGEPDVPAAQRPNVQTSRPATYLLQFAGPMHDDWKARVEAAGARLYGYVPDYAFIARMTPAVVERVQALPFVRWVGLYHPAYRLAPTLTQDAIRHTQYVTLTIQTLPNADLDRLAKQVQALGGDVQRQSANDFAGYLRLTLLATHLSDLAALDEVLWVEPYFEPQLYNDVGGGAIMRASEVRTSLGLYGSDQIVAVADTGLDVGTTGTAMSDDFEGRIVEGQAICAYFQGGRTTWNDFDAHGTHVAGSVLGSGQNSGSNPTAHQYGGSFAGVAPESQLVFQSIDHAPGGGLECIPEDLSTYIFGPAYDLGARVHTNSWGGPTGGTEQNPEYGGYTTQAQAADQAAWTYKDLLILYAAGNSGVDANADGVVDPDSMGSPGTAKNVLTVGASENVRLDTINTWGGDDYPVPPINGDLVADNADGMAAFSSRGPTDDGRIKPDVAAPGTNIISARSHDPDAGTGWGVYDGDYLYMGGTSMSTPLTAGGAAVVREWLTRIKSVANPSGALMKAVLINGAADMSPGQYTSPQEIPAARPNNVTGWGRVDLVGSVDPPSPRQVWLNDHTTGLSTGGSVEYTLSISASQVQGRGEGETGREGDGETPRLPDIPNTQAWLPRLMPVQGISAGLVDIQTVDQLIQNGGFESDGSWTTNATARTNTQHHSG
ncbi:MAG: S8 family serine peptidase, partial [Chloroflexota bacterium]|nr:S8 family serine peptidase [Chloroflexota bacterium]